MKYRKLHYQIILFLCLLQKAKKHVKLMIICFFSKKAIIFWEKLLKKYLILFVEKNREIVTVKIDCFKIDT